MPESERELEFPDDVDELSRVEDEEDEDVVVDDDDEEDADVCAGGGALLLADELEFPEDCWEDCGGFEFGLPEFAGAPFEYPAGRCSEDDWLERCVCCCAGRCDVCCAVWPCGEFCEGGGETGRWTLRLPLVLVTLPVLLFWDCGVCAPDCVCGRCVWACVCECDDGARDCFTTSPIVVVGVDAVALAEVGVDALDGRF